MLIARLCAWVLMLTFPAYFTTTLVLKHRPQASLTHSAGEWLRASICEPPPEYYEAQIPLVNLTVPIQPEVPSKVAVDDFDDGLPYDAEWRRIMSSKVYRGTSATSAPSTGAEYVLGKYQLVEPTSVLVPVPSSTGTDLLQLVSQDWEENDLIAVLWGLRPPREMEMNSWRSIGLEIFQFMFVIFVMLVVVLLGAAVMDWFSPAWLGIADERPAKPPVVVAGDQQQLPMITVPDGDTNHEELEWRRRDRRPSLLLQQNAVPNFAPPARALARPGSPPPAQQAAHRTDRNAARRAEEENRARARAAAAALAEQQERRDAHRARHFNQTMDNLRERRESDAAERQRQQSGNRFAPLAGPGDDVEVMLD